MLTLHRKAQHMKKDFICPQLHIWRQVYVVLEQARDEANDPDIPLPPSVFNMQGWMLSDDQHKQKRWRETCAWAEQHGFLHLIPEIPEEEWYDGE
jgi:hypothetical protein